MSAESKTSDAELNSSPSYLLASLFAARKAGDKLLERLNTRRLAELGIKGCDLEVWNAVAVPTATSSTVVNRLAALVSEIARSPEMRQRLFTQGWQVVGSSPEGLANRMRQDTAVLSGVIARQGIRNE